ncbi:MAG: hypothetical protein KDB27_35950 [Planctomycetales bacterium]|nr:hypothetical protein [Planctomycetales bacterium]
MAEQAQSTQDVEICVFEEAVPSALFERLTRAVRVVGRERMTGNGSYTTNFWFPRGAVPTNVVEETITELLRLVSPSPQCIGTEWWLGRLGYGKELRFHFDRDLALKRKTGESVHPLLASVLYLNDFPSSPTVILDQVIGPDGKSRVPEKAEFAKSIDAVANRYVVFPGTLRHGVIPNWGRSEQASSPERDRKSSELRLTLLVNYWHRRPLPPICSDYDGTIYAPLRDKDGNCEPSDVSGA